MNLFFPPPARLGYTYLRLKDNHMEILNKDDEIERWVVAATKGVRAVVRCVGREEVFV